MLYTNSYCRLAHLICIKLRTSISYILLCVAYSFERALLTHMHAYNPVHSAKYIDILPSAPSPSANYIIIKACNAIRTHTHIYIYLYYIHGHVY